MHINPAHGLESPGEKQREGKMHLADLEEKQTERCSPVLLKHCSSLSPLARRHRPGSFLAFGRIPPIKLLVGLLFLSLLLQCPLQELHFAHAHKGVFPIV